MNSPANIRPAEPSDAGAIATMLRQLAEELGDGAIFASTGATVRRHGFGEIALFDALIAEADGQPQGLALFFRHFSTTRGQPGVYVQDLWVARAQRGQGLGTRLIAAVADRAARGWRARYLSLTVHHNNPNAQCFYTRLGFIKKADDTPMVLEGAVFHATSQRTEIDG